MLQPGFEELSPPLQPPQHQMPLAASRQSRRVPAAQLTRGHLKTSRRYPDIFQLIPVITLLSSPPAWQPASRAAVLCSQESLVGGREEAVSTKTTSRRRELELQQSTLKAFSMNENATTSPGNPSEGVRRLQSSLVLAQEGVSMPSHLLHIRRQYALPVLDMAWI